MLDPVDGEDIKIIINNSNEIIIAIIIIIIIIILISSPIRRPSIAITLLAGMR